MREPLITVAYGRVIVIDTQVVLETRPLTQLPWGELGGGPILLVVCRQVQSEIDAKKGDGRLGERSRHFNRLLDAFVETRTPATLLREGPRVDVALVANSRIDWDALDDLDREDGDDRIVAQTLNALVDDRSRLELLSHDMRPRDAAIAHGIRAIKLPEHWLREKAQTAEEREIARLKRELAVASSDQPVLEIDIEPIGERPWRQLSVLPATEGERVSVETVIVSNNPPPRTSYSRLGMIDPFEDESLPHRYDEWKNHLLRRDLPLMHDGLSRLFSQERLRVTVRNVGSIPAEGMLLEIRSGNATLHATPFSMKVFGDAAPRARRYPHYLDQIEFDGRPTHRNEPFTFYDENPGPGPVVSWSCGSFRQERRYSVEISVELLSSTGLKAEIEVVLTASNLKGDVRARRMVDVEHVTAAFGEVYAVGDGRLNMLLTYSPKRDGFEGDVAHFHNDGSVAH
jgi:hypothetical protein